MMLVKCHERGVVSLCDRELLGKQYTEGKFSLEIGESFYGGEEKDEEEVITLLQTAQGLNIVGENAVQFVLRLGIIVSEDVFRVQGVPHVQVYAFD